MKARFAILCLVLSGLAAAPALAQSSRPRRIPPTPTPAWELNFNLVFTDYERDVDLDDEIGFGARFGYLITPAHEVEFLMNFVSTNDVVFPDLDVDTTNFQTAYVFNFTSSGVVPYLTIGVGLFTTDDESLGTETDLALGLGGGVRFFLGRVAYARIEYRYTQFEGDGEVYVDGLDVSVNELGFGVGWRFPIH